MTVLPRDHATTALLTDRYELTMLESALRDGASARRCVFEVFARRLPEGRRYGVVAGTARLIEAIESFRFDDAVLRFLREGNVIDDATVSYLASYRFSGEVDGYRAGGVDVPH